MAHNDYLAPGRFVIQSNVFLVNLIQLRMNELNEIWSGCMGASLVSEPPPPQDHQRALGMSVLYDPREGLIIISEVPLYLAHAMTDALKLPHTCLTNTSVIIPCSGLHCQNLNWFQMHWMRDVF